MFCRNCGVQIDSSDPFCVNCGAKAGPTNSISPRPAKRGTWSVLVLVLGAFFLVWVLIDTQSSRSSKVENSAPEAPAVAAQETPAVVSHKMNETVQVGVWSYEVTRVRWVSSIGSDYTRELPDAKFLLVDLLIRNDDRTPSTLAPLKLIDAENREFDESSKGALLDGSFGLLKSVNPGVTSRGTVVFDVPEGKYVLRVPGGFASHKSATIDLE
jgi:hypothetical protein